MLKTFVEPSDDLAIKVIVDIGVNVGDTLVLLPRYCSEARSIGF
jgi:hypothetical protein